MTPPPPQGLAIVSDTSSEEGLRQHMFPHVMLSGRVNLFVLPSPDAANIPYSLARVMTNAVATGPIPMGLDQLAHVLAPHVTEHDVVNMTAIACIEGRVRL